MHDSIHRQSLRSYKAYRLSNPNFYTIFLHFQQCPERILGTKTAPYLVFRKSLLLLFDLTGEILELSPFFSIPDFGFLDQCIESDAVIEQCIEQTTSLHYCILVLSQSSRVLDYLECKIRKRGLVCTKILKFFTIFMSKSMSNG